MALFACVRLFVYNTILAFLWLQRIKKFTLRLYDKGLPAFFHFPGFIDSRDTLLIDALIIAKSGGFHKQTGFILKRQMIYIPKDAYRDFHKYNSIIHGLALRQDINTRPESCDGFRFSYILLLYPDLHFPRF